MFAVVAVEPDLAGSRLCHLLCDFGKIPDLFELQFPHLYNGDDIRAYLMDLLAQLNDVLCTECLA